MLPTMLLCVARLPGRPDDNARVAQALGVALADASHRLAGVLPRVITSSGDPEVVGAQVTALLGLGVVAFGIDPSTVPTDRDRLVATRIAFRPHALVCHDRAGEHEIAWDEITLVQRGVRSSESKETVTTKESKFSLGRAVLTSGLSTKKTVEKTETRTTVARESFLHLSRDGGTDVVLYERRLDYRGLERVEPSSLANFNAVQERVKKSATRARFDDRLGRPGFLAGPLLGLSNGVDVALEMVKVAVAAGS